MRIPILLVGEDIIKSTVLSLPAVNVSVAALESFKFRLRLISKSDAPTWLIITLPVPLSCAPILGSPLR